MNHNVLCVVNCFRPFASTFYFAIMDYPNASDRENFSEMSTHIMNIYAKFHWNPSSKYRDITSREIGVNGRTDGQPKYMMLFA